MLETIVFYLSIFMNIALDLRTWWDDFDLLNDIVMRTHFLRSLVAGAAFGTFNTVVLCLNKLLIAG
jgi:hypothetical protein